MRKVLIANRGEIAVRVIRACRDAGLASVAVYADPDRDALHVRAGRRGVRPRRRHPRHEPTWTSPSSSTPRRQSGADAIHPGYGFLARTPIFAQAVIDAGLIWIGPPPAAIDALGDKVQARHIAAARRRPAGARHRRPGRVRRRGRRLRRGARPAGRDQGRLRRRRPRHEGRPHDRGDPRAVRLGDPRGGHRVRPRRVLRRALPRQAAPRRDPVPGRPARQRRRRLAPATARCSAATRSSSRRPPRRSSPTSR